MDTKEKLGWLNKNACFLQENREGRYACRRYQGDGSTIVLWNNMAASQPSSYEDVIDMAHAAVCSQSMVCLRLYEARMEKKLSIRDVAKLAGVSTRTVMDCESPKGKCSLRSLNRIAYALGLVITAI